MAAKTASVSGQWSNSATWGGTGVPAAGDTITINLNIEVIISVGDAVDIGDYTEAAGAAVLSILGRLRITGGTVIIRGCVNMHGNTTFTSPSQGVAVGRGTLEWTGGSITCDHGVTGLPHPWRIMTSALTSNYARFDAIGPVIPLTGPTATEFASMLQFSVIGSGSTFFMSGTGTTTAGIVSGGGNIKWVGVHVDGNITDGVVGAGVGFCNQPWTSSINPACIHLEGVYVTNGVIGAVEFTTGNRGDDIIVLQHVNFGITGLSSHRGLWIITLPLAKTTGTRRVAGCVFPGRFSGLSGSSNSLRDFEFGKIGVDGDPNQVIAHNYFHQFPQTSLPSTAAVDVAPGWTYSMVRATDSQKLAWGPDAKNSAFIWYAPSSASQLTNPSFCVSIPSKSTVYDGCVWDATYTDGDGDSIHAPTSPPLAQSVTIVRCICLFDILGQIIGTMPTCQLGANGSFGGNNNTIGAGGGVLGSVSINEANDGHANECNGWTDNIICTTAIGGTIIHEPSVRTTAAHNSVDGSLVHHNAIEVVYTGAGIGALIPVGNSSVYGTHGPYLGTFSDTYGATAPGANDLVLGNLGAQLVNRNANMATWYRSIAGGTPDVEPANDFNLAFLEIAKYGTPSWDSRYNVPAYIAYRRAMATPQNPLLLTSSSTGGTRGAVQVSSGGGGSAVDDFDRMYFHIRGAHR